MKQILLKIAVVWAGIGIASVTAPAQIEVPDSIALPGQGTNSKHLSATGRMSDRGVRASRLVGAQVNDWSGNRVGEIRDIILNPQTGQIDFALLLLSETAPSAKLNFAPKANRVPVPWVLLKSSGAQCSDNSETLIFTLNADQSKVVAAPAVDWPDPNESHWRQRIYAYYGVTPQSRCGNAAQ